MFDDEDILLGYMALKIITNVKENKRKREFWVRPSLNKSAYSDVNFKSDGYGLKTDESTRRSAFQNFIRMSATDFEQLITIVERTSFSITIHTL